MSHVHSSHKQFGYQIADKGLVNLSEMNCRDDIEHVIVSQLNNKQTNKLYESVSFE